MQERRRARRIGVSFIVVYKLNTPIVMHMSVGRREMDAVAVDLSENGMAVLTSCEIPKTAKTSISFAIVDDKAFKKEDRYKSIEIDGEVRYNVYVKDKKSYRVGLNFIGLSESERDFIVNFVKKTFFSGRAKGGVSYGKNATA